MVPAIPRSRRILVGGYSVIDSVALSRTDVASRCLHYPVTEVVGCRDCWRRRPIIPGQRAYRADIGDEGAKRSKSAGFTGATAARRAGDSGRSDNRRRCRCHRRGVVALNWNVLAVDPGPPPQTAGGSSRPDARSAEQRARRLTADGQRGSILIVAGSATPVTQKTAPVFDR